MATESGLASSLGGNAAYDALKELCRVMLPFSAAAVLGWLQANPAEAFIAAIVVAVAATYWSEAARRKVRSIGALKIDKAEWRCVNDPNVAIDVTETLSSLVDGDKLDVLINNETLGDPCMNHSPFVEGHGKRLHIDYSRRGKAVILPNRYLRI